jgi:hypothetical protein
VRPARDGAMAARKRFASLRQVGAAIRLTGHLFSDGLLKL